MRSRCTPPLLLAAVGVLLALPGWTAKSVEVHPVEGGARLTVNGKLITFFRASNGSLSAERRAEIAAERIEFQVDRGLKPGEVSYRKRPDGTWGVYAGGGLVMIATPEEAALRNVSMEATARLWAVNLKNALGGTRQASAGKRRAKPRPKAPAAAPAEGDVPVTLGVRVTDVAVPCGETRSVTVRGTAAGAIALRVQGDCVEARVVGGDSVELRGLTPGKAVVRIARGGKETAFTAWVKKWAGAVAETPYAMVTGTTAPAEYVRKVVRDKALEGVRCEPGATVKIVGDPEGVKPLARGETALVRVPISIDGPSYLERRAWASVRVDNVALQPSPARVLLYSNDPESVREYGTLFEGLVEDAGPARLMFHHQNRMGRTFTFAVHLLNPNQTPVDVQIIEADAGPVLDTIQVGHRAAQRYMEATAHDRGYIITIPPRKARTVYQVRLPDRLTVSGLYNFRVLDGGPLVAQVSASPRPDLPEVTDDLVAAARSELDSYPFPQKDEEYRYAVGGTWTFIPLGRKPILAKTPNKKLFGNYGVLYNLKVELANPTDEEKTVTVRLAAEAGWTRGVFVIDGKLVEAPQIAPPSEAVLWSVKLAPQEHRQVRIQGIPVGGSAYPVSLVVRS